MNSQSLYVRRGGNTKKIWLKDQGKQTALVTRHWHPPKHWSEDVEKWLAYHQTPTQYKMNKCGERIIVFEGLVYGVVEERTSAACNITAKRQKQ